MTIIQLILILCLISYIDNNIYLYYTEDSSSVEFYDCIYQENFLYCRRPIEPISLERNNNLKECYHNGTLHTFSSLQSNKININTILHKWKSSLEKVEEFSRYIKQNLDSIENFLCECNHPQSFGKYCEYLLPYGTTFTMTLNWENQMKFLYKEENQYYSDILCYKTLTCNSGLLCLDWRDICDGIQQCQLGYDEENCDKLEFNECEYDEYRCMNGMCISREYFLDGDYDCMDLSDEIQLVNDRLCIYHEISMECDDRICFPNTWSCGDGQCIINRLAFQIKYSKEIECNNRRDQYYMCEIHANRRQWTLSNGKCYFVKDFIEFNSQNRSIEEECIYFTKCAFSMGLENNCPCKYDPLCFEDDDTESPCSSENIPYPNGAIIAPYLYFIYNNTSEWWSKIPDYIQLNGTIKCRGYMINQQMTIPYISKINLKNLEAMLCNSTGIIENKGYDINCYNNNHSSYFLHVCNQSKECISHYRINDGYINCADEMDEQQNQLILNYRHDRFQCSSQESIYLSVNNLGDLIPNCKNNYDEWWLGKDMMLSQMKCNQKSKDDCKFIQQYINNYHENSLVELFTTKIPFRTYCDTFWNLGSKYDENIELCSKQWICLDEQWQCHTGQCINVTWVLDGEWDCKDASDEESLFFYNHSFSLRNLQVISLDLLKDKFESLYGITKQPFSKICNLTTEFPCFRVNASNSLYNITFERPCINLQQIGDERIDCIGGIDERNTIQHCNYPTMLGNDFLCITSNTCIDKSNLCKITCPNPLDNHLLCSTVLLQPDCSLYLNMICMDGKCVEKSDICNRRHDCYYGEDEYMCDRSILKQQDSIKIPYRSLKESMAKNMYQKIDLPKLPISSNSISNSIIQEKTLMITPETIPTSSNISYYCNRGVGVFLHNKSISCFCPPFYYGDKCQYYSDRFSIILHLNLSQSAYKESTNYTILLKLLVLFLYENQTLDIHEYHVRPAFEMINFKKKIGYFLYSRSKQLLQNKIKRYFNRSNIINEHPYSIRIEIYELKINMKPKLIAIWKYLIYFDYLPSYRLTKVLRLIQLNNIKNPCSRNPCNSNEECYPLMNQISNYICLCSNNLTGNNCLDTNQMCIEGFCALNSLCKPDYRNILNGNEIPYCVCPLNQYGRRCNLFYDKCLSNPCQNNGICLISSKPDQFSCKCSSQFYGDLCELQTQAVTLFLNESVYHEGAVIQYFHINFLSLDLILTHQGVFRHLPNILSYFYMTKTAPDIIIVKLYSNNEMKLYLISLQLNVISINETTFINETNHCKHVRSLDQGNQEEISSFNYHHLCINRHNLTCFIDDIYLCICNENHTRVECFGYDINLDQCSFCLNNGKCLKGNQLQTNEFICLCSQCNRGSLCQFNTDVQSFSLDSLLIENKFDMKIVYLLVAIIIFIIGILNNYITLITFKRPNLFKIGVGKYLFLLSFISQCSLLSLLIKTLQSIFELFLNDLSCKIIAFLLSVFTRYSFWLISWATLDRLYSILFPFSNLLKKSCTTYIISIITLIIVGIMHIHELLFYIIVKDPHGQIICVANFTRNISVYNRITVLIHYMVPFAIQIISITILIYTAAQTRLRATRNSKTTFTKVFKQQFNNYKELYVTPSIIILSSLPQVILAFSLNCNEPLQWQRHALLIVYFLSYIPQLLGFILFILPSRKFLKEFRETSLAKRWFFQWILPKVKTNKPRIITQQLENGFINTSML
ncbi:unnamed protein product [Adineta steineri]|uniref:EGF-like domain-containing protein n=1 Tax=Adineta steineri TaxID=433720 RepID=A0A815N2T3_9BILA|nr:unnamed protein product [Adineta steineri]